MLLREVHDERAGRDGGTDGDVRPAIPAEPQRQTEDDPGGQESGGGRQQGERRDGPRVPLRIRGEQVHEQSGGRLERGHGDTGRWAEHIVAQHAEEPAPAVEPREADGQRGQDDRGAEGDHDAPERAPDGEEQQDGDGRELDRHGRPDRHAGRGRPPADDRPERDCLEREQQRICLPKRDRLPQWRPPQAQGDDGQDPGR